MTVVTLYRRGGESVTHLRSIHMHIIISLMRQIVCGQNVMANFAPQKNISKESQLNLLKRYEIAAA